MLEQNRPYQCLVQHMMLCSTQAGRQWPVGEDRRVALAKSGSTRSRRMPALYTAAIYNIRCGDLRSPGATERRNGSLGLRDDDDDDEGWLVSKMECKTNFSRHIQTLRNRDCWMFENHWRIGCNLKQFDKADRNAFFIFGRKRKCRRKWNSIFGRKRKPPVPISQNLVTVQLRT